jgi:hypothetical protein
MFKMVENSLKQNILTAVIQLVAIAVYAVAVLMMIKVEYIVLNPIPYFAGAGLAVLLINVLILLFIFRDKPMINNKVSEFEKAAAMDNNTLESTLISVNKPTEALDENQNNQ